MPNDTITTISGKDRNTAISLSGEDGEVQISVRGHTVRLDTVSFERLVSAGPQALRTQREWVLVGGRPVLRSRA